MKSSVTKPIYLLIIIMILGCLWLKSNCFASEHGEVFNFTKDYIESLGDCRLAQIAEEDSLANNAGDIKSTIDLMKTARLKTVRFNTAILRLDPYKNSSNKLIKEAAAFIINSYQMLKEACEEGLRMQEKLLNEKEETLNQGKYASKASELQAKSEMALEQLMRCSVLVDDSLIDLKPDENNHCCYLNITSVERKELIDKMHSIFDAKIDEIQPKSNFSYVDGAAALVMKILKDDHKSADERPKAN